MNLISYKVLLYLYMENNLKLAVEMAKNGQNITESLIPDNWKESFNKFMFGQTCMVNEKGEFETYPQDFLIWYFRNEKEINREIKIDDII
jgi:hypothetical protein